MSFRRPALLVIVLTLVSLGFPHLDAAAVAPANSHFHQTWARPDKPVADGQVSRTWIWGPDAFTEQFQEPYQESPGGQRVVQYFDKSRMEIPYPYPEGDPNSVWYVTNGLLVNELMSGRIQVGDDAYLDHQPAEVNVAGDADDSTGVTYRFLSFLTDETATPEGQVINKILTPTAATNAYLFSDEMAAYGVVAAYYVPETQHTVAGPFWEFLTSSGLVYDGGSYVTARIFEDPFFATGYPVTEAYWAEVKVAGHYTDVLLQCFQRRCLTYTPGNPAGWQVESGNVGQHYYNWRYGQGTAPPANPSAPDPPAAPDQPTGPSLPEPILTDAWLYPDAAALRALEELGGSANVADPTVQLLMDLSFRLRGLYNLETAPVGTWNHDTTNFYPWLKNRVAEWYGAPPSEDRSWVASHVYNQSSQAINGPTSNIGQWVRWFEIVYEDYEPGLGPMAYWDLLFGPYMVVQPVMPYLDDAVVNSFLQVVNDYRYEQSQQPGRFPDFGSYLAYRGIVTPYEF